MVHTQLPSWQKFCVSNFAFVAYNDSIMLKRKEFAMEFIMIGESKIKVMLILLVYDACILISVICLYKILAVAVDAFVEILLPSHSHKIHRYPLKMII